MRYFNCISKAVLTCTMLSASVANATEYYISNNTGNDTNNGLTAATAWKSLGKFNSFAFATSDSVYLKAGDTWTISGVSTSNVGWSGTASAHVTIGAYHTDSAGNAVIGLGTGTRPKVISNHVFQTVTATQNNARFDFSPAFQITGSNVDLRDLEVDNWGEGVKIAGAANVTVTNLLAVNPYWLGVSVESATNATVSNSEVVGSSQGYGVWNDTSDWTPAIAAQATNGFIVQNCFLHEGWGEGVNTYKASSNADISHNLVFAQRAVGIYTDWAQNVKIHDNLILGTSNSTYWRSGGFVGAGIAIANEPGEVSDPTKSTKNVAVYDNLVAGNIRGIDVQRATTSPTVQAVSIYNNTLVDNSSQFGSGGCTTCIVENNIFLSITAGTVDIPAGSGLGITYHNNYWSRGTPATGIADSTTDVYSGLILTKTSGWQSIANASALPTWQSFAPVAGSSTFQKGTALLAAPYNVDYNGTAHRNPMDLGAIAGTGRPPASGGVTPDPAARGTTITVTDTFTAAVTDGNAEIIFWINDSANNLLGRCGVFGTPIAAGQPKTATCTFAIPATAATGTYHTSGTIYQSTTDATAIQGITTFATFTIN